MGHRRQRSTDISAADLERLIAAARACNEAACAPRLRIGSEHYAALNELSQTIRKTIITLTGDEPPWVYRK